MRTCIIPARVEHQRLYPKAHFFEYRLPVYRIAFDELEELEKHVLAFSHNRVNVLSFYDRDYFDENDTPVKEKLFAFLRKKGVSTDAVERVELVTGLRFLSYVFNPVSFYYVYDSVGLLCGVAEVNNTFGEKHVYLLKPEDGGELPAQFMEQKTFHVSPFFERRGQYEFFFGALEDSLDIRIHLTQDKEEVFQASLSSRDAFVPFTTRNILVENFRVPAAAHLTWPRIVWEAMKLRGVHSLPFHKKPQPMSENTVRTQQRRWEKGANRVARALVFWRFKKIEHGALTCVLPGGKTWRFGSEHGPQARIDVKNMRFFRRLLAYGNIGLGESYVQKDWSSPDLNMVFRVLLANRRVLTLNADNGAMSQLNRRMYSMWRRVLGPFKPNTKTGSKDNIQAHYDLSNDLFSRFLDPGMVYSCAVFKEINTAESLEAAQLRKIRMIADKAQIRKGDRVLEIGCGWGSFALDTARRLGCHVLGVTLSQEQYDYAQARVAEEGLEEQVEIRLQDYRDVEGRFDAIVSIEMIEAVGYEFHPTFFRTIDERLAPGGRAVIQAITIQDWHYEAYRRSLCWVRKHIFPGGMLMSLTRTADVLARSTELVIVHAEQIGQHYARTLHEWRERFEANWPDIRAYGFDERFYRSWIYYLVSCEEGFRRGHIDDYQIVMTRPEEAALRGTALFR